jgi:hypothetical protein
VPGLYQLSCLTGSCCRQVRDAQRAAVPNEVTFTSIYSPDDQVVAARDDAH